MNSSHDTNPYRTPDKDDFASLQVVDTADYTPERATLLDQRVDYKLKTFKLMKQLAETQVANRKHTTHIRHLEKEIQAYRRQMDKIVTAIGASNLDEAYRKIEALIGVDKQSGNDPRLAQWGNIIEEYKKIINAQQYKYIKLEQQYKISEVKLKRYEQDRERQDGRQGDNEGRKGGEDSKKYQEELKKYQQETKKCQEEVKRCHQELESRSGEMRSLEEEVSLLKNQYKQAIIEKEQLKESYEKLQSSQTLNIQYFEEMQRNVEVKLFEVERDMTFYRQEREQHLEKIQLLKKQLDLKERQAYFSFGGKHHVQVQTQEGEEDNPHFNSECLEISIKTLLEENDRLKNTLLALYTKRPEEELPKEVELELKILLNMRDSNMRLERKQESVNLAAENQDRRERERQERREERQEREQERAEIATMPETIIEQSQEEQSQELPTFAKELVGLVQLQEMDESDPPSFAIESDSNPNEAISE